MSSTNAIGQRRRAIGYTQQELAEMIRAQVPGMTENRLTKIETGRLKARPEEKEIIARLLGCRTWELDCEVNQ